MNYERAFDSFDVRKSRDRRAILTNMLESLIHLTINTNHLRISPRAEVSVEALLALAPWKKSTANKAMPLPGMPGIAARSHSDPVGWAQLDIWASPSAQIVQAALVWTNEAELQLWPRIVTQTRRIGIIASELRKPTTLPWLAVALTPRAATVPPETLMALADLERCWAWAVLADLTQR